MLALLYLFVSCSLALVTAVQANTEKAIFTGPASITIPEDVHPGLGALQLESLSPARRTLRKQLAVRFPTKRDQSVAQSWYLLEGLEEGRRYEVRICWAATQPTVFSLDTHTITDVFATPSLIQALAVYAEERQEEEYAVDAVSRDQRPLATSVSTLFLQICAAADYFTLNETLMREPPAVDVDIILDPYILNVFPQSLLPTAAYIKVLALASYSLSGVIWAWLLTLKTVAETKSSLVMTTPPYGLLSHSQYASLQSQPQLPPRPQHPFYSLPTELILEIVDHLPHEDSIAFAFANYPLFLHFGLAPPLTRNATAHLINRSLVHPRNPRTPFIGTSLARHSPVLPLPAELLLQVLRFLERPIDTMRFVVANYHDLALHGIAPPLDKKTRMVLRTAVFLGTEDGAAAEEAEPKPKVSGSLTNGVAEPHLPDP
ncbi:hypothetical protein B0A49_04555 [Cryomyces minteri]|uniref:F-box domain-containing protein n=1 Tax=Cryomyces minteri TaxID=331657 RepID=A0A4V5NHD0_9PEZI|nr:hypothetical protein B0A49_04555 [Cryomyces minteri]